jgi:hypothetical protein
VRLRSQLPLPAVAALQRGKEGILVPSAAPGGVTRPLAHLPARAELQALAVAVCDGEELLAAVDGYGHVALQRRPCSGAAGDDGDALFAAGGPCAVASLLPRVEAVEPSWAGVAFAPGAPRTLATARHLARTVRAQSQPHTCYALRRLR